MGDLGNVTADKDGKAKVSIEDAVISLSGDHSIIGRTMVVSVPVIRIHITFLLTHSRVSFMRFILGAEDPHNCAFSSEQKQQFFVG